MIYLDHATKTKPSPEILDGFCKRVSDQFASPLAPHQEGQRVAQEVIRDLEMLRDLLGLVDTDQIYLSPSHPISYQAILHHCLTTKTREMGKTHYLATQIDEATTCLSLEALKDWGCDVDFLPVNSQGVLTAQVLQEALTPQTALLSVQLANGTLGTIQPLEEIRELCQERGVVFHVDVKHALGKIPLSLDAIQADFVTFSFEVSQAPLSLALCIKDANLKWNCPYPGSSPQTFGFLEPALLKVVYQALLENFEKRMDTSFGLLRVRNAFEEKLVQNPGVEVLFSKARRLPGISVVHFEGVHQEALLYRLNQKGIYAHIGGGHTQDLSHLLSCCALAPYSAISFAFSPDQSVEEVIQVVPVILEEYQTLRSLSL